VTFGIETYKINLKRARNTTVTLGIADHLETVFAIACCCATIEELLNVFFLRGPFRVKGNWELNFPELILILSS
jgi:hypothetical protein